ncbi:MAG: phenylalanine--tRNA ligase subunit beta, partial [Chitinophagaceae bacterium]
NLLFFEFGKTYLSAGPGKYEELNHLCLYATGNTGESAWRSKSPKADFYFLKGIVTSVCQLLGVTISDFSVSSTSSLATCQQASINLNPMLEIGLVSQKLLERFDIRQPVVFADLYWDGLLNSVESVNGQFTELPKQLSVKRDLAVIVPKTLSFDAVEKSVKKINLARLQSMQLFDVFESEKLGPEKKSMAVSFTFLDKEKTLNELEIDGMMSQIMTSFQDDLQAEIRI